jgi:hypothetical protein
VAGPFARDAIIPPAEFIYSASTYVILQRAMSDLYDVLGVTLFILEEKSLEAKKKLGLRSQNNSISHLCILGTYIMHLPTGIAL